jgi:hypothetical protein
MLLANALAASKGTTMVDAPLKMPCIAYGRNAGISLGEPVQVVRRCSRSLSAALRWLRKLTHTRARWRWRQSIQALQPPGRLTLTTHHSSSCWRTPQHPCSQERREVTGSRDVGRGTIPRRMGSGTGSHSLVLCQTNSLVQCCFEAIHLHVLSSRESRLRGDD